MVNGGLGVEVLELRSRASLWLALGVQATQIIGVYMASILGTVIMVLGICWVGGFTAARTANPGRRHKPERPYVIRVQG